MASTQFEGLLTTLLGYIIIAVSLAFLHCLMSLLRFKKYVFTRFISIDFFTTAVRQCNAFPYVLKLLLSVCVC